MLEKTLTVVLPVHNAESRLRRNVGELLELASELTAKFGVLIIDDGSTDSTFEVAEELASRFPQVTVRRHRQSRGLGAALEYAKRRVRSDAVIIHDGVTPINANEMRGLWQRWILETAPEHSTVADAGRRGSVKEFAKLTSLHTAMERVHRQVVGFQLMTHSASDDYQATGSEIPVAARRDESHGSARGGLGSIPTLPRPKFLSAIAAFALGE